MSLIRRHIVPILLFVTTLAGSRPVHPADKSASGSKHVQTPNHKVEILRDEYGIPHIFARSAADASFGYGYAQAEDRLEQLLKNYREAEGDMAEAFGKEWFASDVRQRRWHHRAIAEQHYSELSPEVRSICEAFQAGIAKYMKEHPEKVPAWAPTLKPWQIIALGRFILWAWPESDGASDLGRAGIPSDPIRYRGSNELLLAPSRTALKVPIALVDPHLSWYGESRLYEVRIYGGPLQFAGTGIVGLPLPSLGHNQYLSIAMTTGGPDTADVYEETIKDGKYQFRNEWHPLITHSEEVVVKDGDSRKSQTVTIEATRHGPIVAHKDGKAYSMAIAYSNEFRLIENIWALDTARNLAEAKKALSQLQFMGQNIMIGTVDGDIYYLRNGRVPRRPEGCDTSKPMPGADGNCEWDGIHSFDDLVQITNPPQGYMQNCNAPPLLMMKDSPLTPDKWALHPYLYNDGRRTLSPRASTVLELADAARQASVEDVMQIALSTKVWHAETWLERIKSVGHGEFARLLASWNGRIDADSRAALAFYLLKVALGKEGREVEPPATLTDAAIESALTQAARQLDSEFPADATFGTLFRVGRHGGSRTWPVSGGTLPEAGIGTPRAIAFAKAGKEMVGQAGQTSTQVVVLTKPPRSYMSVPLGESDDPSSPHFDDQAGQLFSLGKLSSTYFMNRRELERHVARTEVLSR